MLLLENIAVCIIADLFAGLGEDIEVNARQLQFIVVLKLIIVSTSLSRHKGKY